MCSEFLVSMRLVCLGLAMLLVGCVHNFQSSGVHIHEPSLTLDQSPVCCNSYDQLSYKVLPLEYRAIISLDSNDPVLDLESGKSHVEAIALPESSGVTALQIDSKVSWTNVIQASTMVFPAITLLDSNYQPVATLKNLPYRYRNPLVGDRRIEVVATIDHRHQDIRYVLIHTTPDRLNQSISTREPFEIFQNKEFETLLYGDPTNTLKRIQFSKFGVLSVLAYPKEKI